MYYIKYSIIVLYENNMKSHKIIWFSYLFNILFTFYSHFGPKDQGQARAQRWRRAHGPWAMGRDPAAIFGSGLALDNMVHPWIDHIIWIIV